VNMKRILSLLFVFSLLWVGFAYAEKRAHPYADEFLLQNISEIFVGEVLAIQTFQERNIKVPIRARVLQTIKGTLTAEDTKDIVPKNPGKFVYFKEEFDNASVGDVGIFFVGCPKLFEHTPNLLIKFKKITLVDDRKN